MSSIRLAVIVCAINCIVGPALGQSIDGDTIKQNGITYRIWGIGAPETRQVCADGWSAGRLAATRMQQLTQGRTIVCEQRDKDRYGRIVAVCRGSGEDLGAIMVRELSLGVRSVQP